MKDKRIILITSIFLVILITLSVTNFFNYNKNISYKNSLKQSTEIANSYKDKITKLTVMLKENRHDKSQDKMVLINEVSTNFLNAFFNYDALSKNKIYDNIKPYSTAYLVNKLKPNKQNELESDVNYKVSITNIRMYTKSIQDNASASILVLADEGIKTNQSDTTSPILVELKLKFINNKWLVDDFLINTPLKNTPFID